MRDLVYINLCISILKELLEKHYSKEKSNNKKYLLLTFQVIFPDDL